MSLFGTGGGKVRPLDIETIRGASERPPVPAGVDTAVPLQRSLGLYLPEVFPIPGATEFYRTAFAASGGLGTITPAALTLQTPQSSLGIVRVFGVGLDGMSAVTDVVFSLRVNGVPVPAWGAYQLFPGPAARVTESSDVWVKLPPASLVEVAITNRDGAAYTVGANYSGWTWPESLDKAWRGQLYREG